MATNGNLYTTVMEKLNFEPRLDASNITVAIKGNHDVVVLGGTVLSFAEKIAAENAVKTIRGVRAVADEIKVDPSTKFQRTDAEIAADAVNALKMNIWIPVDKIKVVVKDGSITLSGEVEWQYQRTSAFSAVKNIRGVRFINNSILVKPSISVDESKVRQEILKEFERHARLDAGKIEVKIDGKKVVLKGEVSNFDEMDIAEDTAWSIAGVTNVDNQLKVI